MADGDGEISKTTENYSPEETFKGTQETQSEHKFPTGIISLPPGCRGPKSLYLKRISGSFGFTLRHFIIYPPDGLAEDDDSRLAALLHAPMETIFVRKVRNPGPAHSAGLQKGDRIVAVNDIQVIDKPYSFVIQLIQKSPAYLHLLVVPKEEDALQRLFTNTAYNPVSNRSFILDSPPVDRKSAQQFLRRNVQQLPEEIQVDAQFWKTLRYPFGTSYKYTDKWRNSFQLDNGKHQTQKQCGGPIKIYTEIEVHNVSTQDVNKAQPQVPLYKKMGRRASEGNTKTQEHPQVYGNLYDYRYDRSSLVSDDEMVISNLKSAASLNLSENTSNSNMSVLTYPSSAGCRLSNNESSSSLNSSSYIDGSKDSLSSNITLTGHETTEDEDSAILSRYRKSFLQKEEFLKTPYEYGHTTKSNTKWPSTIPNHQHFQLGRNDIESERVFEAPPAPKDMECEDNRRVCSPTQLVQTRTKQFESGRALPRDDPLLSDRTSFYKSELAKISSKRLVPNVSTRAQEYETRTTTMPSSKRLLRDCKSLESSAIQTTNQQQRNLNSIVVGDKKLEEKTKIDITHPLIPESVKLFPATQISKENEREEEMLPVVKRRVKNSLAVSGIDDRITRRESYLKATEGCRLPFDLSETLSPQILRSAHRRWRPPLFPGDIQQLRKLFEDAASSFGGSVSGDSSSSTSLEKDKVYKQFEHEEYAIIREGTLNCKITELDGKRPPARSWRQTCAVIRGPKLYLYKDKSHNIQSPVGTSDLLEQSLLNGIDIQNSLVRVAEDYTKKKHVLKITSMNPCRSELLLQAENGEELSEWMKVFKKQGAAIPKEIEFSKTDQLAPGVLKSLSPSDNHTTSLSQPLSISASERNISPSNNAQSPVKTRKTQFECGITTSPKSKTWRGRVAKQFRKIQGTNSPSSPTSITPPEGSTFGVPLEQCISSSHNRYVPKFVEVCTDIVDKRGLKTIGIYRVPGNNASITGLSEEINRNYEDVPTDDVRWNDVHVVSSLLKSFFRKLPDSLVTNTFYLSFIRADKIDTPKERMKELKRLVKNLPPHNYCTLKHLILHLNRVMENSKINKMDAKNVAIVFGPNIVRPEEETMADMVSNNSHQCKILVTLLNYAKWFFFDTEEEIDLDTETLQDTYEDAEAASNQQSLLESISKLEPLPHKEKNSALFTSIISAAQKKVKRKTKGLNSLPDNSKHELSLPNNSSLPFAYSLNNKVCEKSNSIPTTIRDIENNQKVVNRVPWFNYATDQEEFQKRIEKFRNETEAMLTRPRYLEINVDKASRNSTSLTTAASNHHAMTKTNSVSDVFDRKSPESRTTMFQQNKEPSISSPRRRTEEGNDFVDSQISRSCLKKLRYESQEYYRTASVDSLNKCGSDDDTDLVSAMTKIYDKKLEDYAQPNILNGDNFPYVDESPDRMRECISSSNKENNRSSVDLYKNPSLHKYSHTKENGKNDEQEKDDDSSAEILPLENERLLYKLTLRAETGSKLKRSESLNKPERSKEMLNKVRRSESLNKTDKILKRSDSNTLTKNEKTECNINKKRELLLTRRSKELKRKNGTPDRSIKRRHTVGGTKDPDKITLLDKGDKEKVRTSSPDLRTTRRERFLFEINLIGPENMVVALRQHLIGGRPQSFPESSMFKVSLESHV